MKTKFHLEREKALLQGAKVAFKIQKEREKESKKKAGLRKQALQEEEKEQRKILLLEQALQAERDVMEKAGRVSINVP
jgi:hypothetical protein